MMTWCFGTVATLHWLVLVAIVAYPWAAWADRRADAAFVAAMFVLTAHWYLFGRECCLSVLEMRIANRSAFDVAPPALRATLYAAAALSVVVVVVRTYSPPRAAAVLALFFAFAYPCHASLQLQQLGDEALWLRVRALVERATAAAFKYGGRAERQACLQTEARRTAHA